MPGPKAYLQESFEVRSLSVSTEFLLRPPYRIAVLDDDESVALSIAEYATASGFEAAAFFTLSDLGSAIASRPFDGYVIDWHLRGTRHGIHVDPEDGLLLAGEPGVQLTWMDARIGDWVVTPRHGKPVEVNALWLNALSVMADFADHLGKSGAHYRSLAERARSGMQRFWSPEHGYLYDVIRNGFGTMPDYRLQIPTNDRWAIVSYVRALQLSQHATLDDVPPAQRGALETQ
jgi:hypothetical protein